MADRAASEREQSELLTSAGQALASGAWGDARERYEQALGLGESAGALEGLAVPAWWQDDVESAIRARAFIEIARERLATAELVVGEMEQLPFADRSFDVVTGFNAFQFAAALRCVVTWPLRTGSG
jgi:hypothetical protein